MTLYAACSLLPEVPVVVNVRELRRLGRKYQELRTLEGGINRADRGREFNGLIADVLRAYDIEARDNIRRAYGEIEWLSRSTALVFC